MLSHITNGLHVSGMESLTPETLQSHSIKTVVNMSQGNTEHRIPESCSYVQYGLPDWRHDFARFKHGVETVRDALQADKNVLVHCHHGQSRSVCVAAAALASETSLTINDAFNQIEKSREINPSPPLRESAERYCGSQSTNKVKTN